MRFVKGHGTGNDFVLLPDPDGVLQLSDAQVAWICDRRTGVGADGILRVVRTKHADHDSGAEWFMDYRNADGSVAEMCGNGIRVYALFLQHEGLVDADQLTIATRDGDKAVWLHDDGTVTVDMGTPRDIEELPDGGVTVSMGNPHVVLFTDDTTTAPVAAVGAALDAEWLGGTNVEFVQINSSTSIQLRVWERGVGETRSCGTGACAAAVGSVLRRGAERRVTVGVPGGELVVDWRADDHVYLTGPAVLVADGELL